MNSSSSVLFSTSSSSLSSDALSSCFSITCSSNILQSSQNPQNVGNSTSQNSMYVTPNMAIEIERILAEVGVDQYEDGALHMLVDILQREALMLLNEAADLSNLIRRGGKGDHNVLKRSKENYNIESQNDTYSDSSDNFNRKNEEDLFLVTREDAELAVNEFMNKHVLHPNSLEDNIRIATTSNTYFMNDNLYESSFPVTKFPTTLGPYLPEDININTIVAGWDLKLKDDPQSLKS